MKICKQCGARYEGAQRFCEKCGHPLSEKRSGPGTQNREYKSKKPLAAIILILAVILIGGAAVGIRIWQEQEQKEWEEREAEVKQAEMEMEEKGDEQPENKLEAEEPNTEEAEEKSIDKELSEKYQAQQEMKEAEEKAKEIASAEEENNTSSSAESQSKDSAAYNQEVSEASLSLYSAWSNTLANAENTDAELRSAMTEGENYEVYQEIYNLWDNLLNQMWQDLKSCLPESTMDSLTEIQLTWIKDKETVISEYWKTRDVDYSTFPNAPAADITKQRVYFLLEKCPKN